KNTFVCATGLRSTSRRACGISVHQTFRAVFHARPPAVEPVPWATVDVAASVPRTPKAAADHPSQVTRRIAEVAAAHAASAKARPRLRKARTASHPATKRK